MNHFEFLRKKNKKDWSSLEWNLIEEKWFGKFERNVLKNDVNNVSREKKCQEKTPEPTPK